MAGSFHYSRFVIIYSLPFYEIFHVKERFKMACTIRNKVDKIWQNIGSGGIVKPITVIEKSRY